MSLDAYEELLAHLDALVAEFESHAEPAIRDRMLERSNTWTPSIGRASCGWSSS